jgi:GLPGLI family protein
MLRYLILSLFFSFVATTVSAQNHIIESGRILYERKINTYAIIPDFIKGSNLVAADDIASFLLRYRNEYPQFWVDSFQLTFDAVTSLYQPSGKTSTFLHGTGVPMAEKNRVYSNLASRRYIAEKNAYNEQRLVSDTLTKIHWKLTDETRDIAGFECRRANALIKDSIYIVAFYTDAIKTKGGPELFNGLPGMILGVAIPHYNISYFATKVDEVMLVEKVIPPSFVNQGSKIREIDYYNAMMSYLKEKKLNNRWMQVFIRL